MAIGLAILLLPINQINVDLLPDRLMVGLRFLVPSIGVRVPVRQRESETDRGCEISVIQQLMLRTAHGHEPQSKSQLNYSVIAYLLRAVARTQKHPRGCFCVYVLMII